jgi:hypothetical protein
MAMKPKKIISSRGESGVGAGPGRGSSGGGSMPKIPSGRVKINTDPSRKSTPKETPAQIAAKKRAIAAANKKLKR